jgi:lantibiotic modifying enzyme
MAWKPILDGELAERAWDAVMAIARDLVSWTDQTLGLEGSAGQAVFLHHLDRARSGEGWKEIAEAKLDAAIDDLSERDDVLPWLNGISGVAWATEHLRGPFEEDDPNEAIDEVFAEMLSVKPSPFGVDLVDGLGCFASYYLSRLPRESARTGLATVLDHYESAATKSGDHAWFVRPDGYVNLGVAHGSPGVVSVLSRLAAAGIESERADSLRESLVRRLFAQRSSKAPWFHFVAEGKAESDWEPGWSWCYGDVGVCSSLVVSARHRAAPWASEAASMLTRLAPPEKTSDPILCHGMAGVSHMFNVAGQLTENAELERIAREWFGSLLDARVDKGIGGFVTKKGSGALVGGASGIGLSLLAGLTPIPPRWGEVLGLW